MKNIQKLSADYSLHKWNLYLRDRKVPIHNLQTWKHCNCGINNVMEHKIQSNFGRVVVEAHRVNGNGVINDKLQSKEEGR